MKNSNLIKRLWTDSHEKQSPQRFARYAAMLIMLLTIGVGQMWADNAVTVYCAINASTMKSGDDCYTLKVNADIGDSHTWRQYDMSIVDHTKSGKLIYTATILEKYGGVDALQFQLYQGDTWKEQKQPYSSWTTSSTFSGKLYDYDAESWSAYSGFDAAITVYFVNTDSWATPKAFAWSGCMNNAAWSGQAMTTTDKTYNGKTIYSINFNKRFENIIFSNNGSNKTSDLTLGSTNAGKIWDGDSWESYNYDVTVSFNMGGHGSAVSSQTILKGTTASEPSTPVDGDWTFEGWYEESTFVHKWNFSSTINSDKVLYAHWTQEPTVTNLSASAGDIYSGEGSITLTATRNTAASSLNIQYQVKVPGGSWTNIGDAVNSTTKTYSPTNGDGTYEFRAYPVGYSSNSSSTDKRVYEHWNIYVRDDVDNWGTMKLYLYDNSTSTSKSAWPGDACSNYKSSAKWYTVTLDSKWPHFILNNNNSGKQLLGNGSIATDKATYTPGSYWKTVWNSKGTGGDSGKEFYTLTSATITDPEVTITRCDVYSTYALLEGNVTGFGGDGSALSDLKEYGFYIGETKNTSIQSTSGTRFRVKVKGLTPGNTYNIKAFATNIDNTAYSAIQSKTASNESRTIGVRYPDATNQTLKLYAYRDIPADYGEETVKNANWSGETLTRRAGTSRWWETTLTNAADYEYFIVSNNGSNQAAAQAMPATDKCYWYNPDGSAPKIGIMDCPFTSPQLYINATAGATDYAYNEMSTSPSISKTMSLSAGTYTFKIMYNAEWYGKDSDNTISRTGATTSNAVSGMTIDQGYITLTADFAGDYIFTFNPSTNTVSVTYPTAYVVTYSKSIVGTDNSTTAAPSAAYTIGATAVTSGDLVPNDTNVTFTAAEAGSGYTWKGWYTVENPSADYTANCVETTVEYAATISAATTIYAVYAEDMHTITLSAEGDGSVSMDGSAGIATSFAITATPDDGNRFIRWEIVSGSAVIADDRSASTTVTATADASIKAVFGSNWVIGGNAAIFGNWNMADAISFDHFEVIDGLTTGWVDVELPANTTYQVKVYDHGNGSWWGHSTESMQTYTYANSNSPWAFGMGNTYNNLQIITAGHGTYRFTWAYNNSGKLLKVTYPGSSTVTYGRKVYYNEDASSADSDAGGTITSVRDGDNLDLVSGKYVVNGSNVVVTASPATGYSVLWYKDAAYTEVYTDGSDDAAISGENGEVITKTITAETGIYAKFSENMTTVNLAATNGKIQYWDGDSWEDAPSSESVGVHTTCSIKAVPAWGYYFAGWENTAGTDYSISVAFDSEDVNSTTLSGLGGGEASGQTLTAKFVELEKVYFYNWAWSSPSRPFWTNDESNHVYAYFAVQEDYGHPRACNTDDPYYIQQMKNEDINTLYAYVPRGVTRYPNDGNNQHIAFSNHQFEPNWKFDSHEAVYWGSYKQIINEFVPQVNDHKPVNSTEMYNGYWKRHDAKIGDEAGYYLKHRTGENTYGDFTNGTDATFKYISDNQIQCKLRIDNSADAENYYMIHSAGGVKYTTAEWPQDALAPDITSANCLNVGVMENSRNDSRFLIKQTSQGYYTLTLTFSTDTMYLKVDYPVAVGDYRLEHSYTVDAVTKKTYSGIIKHDDDDQKAFTSMYLNTDAGTKSLKMQTCTSIDGNGHPVWSTGVDVANFTTSSFKDGKGVYSFLISWVGNDAGYDVTSATPDIIALYDGEYYIKTDYATGGWTNWIMNNMEKNTINFRKENPKTFDYYYATWVDEEHGDRNVKCVVGNIFNEALCDTLVNDEIANEYLTYDANVRFSYNSYTNELKRAYINGANDGTTDYLYLQGTSGGNQRILNTNGEAFSGNKVKFRDRGNWIYEIDIKAEEGARVKLISDYYHDEAHHYQYLKGNEGEWSDATTSLILGGEAHTTAHLIRVVYDFKTNHLISAWLAGGTEGVTRAINTNAMIIREHQGQASQIEFANDGVSLTDIDTVYSVMKFNKWTINNKSKDAGHADLDLSQYERDLFWISFPYDVKLSDVFGFGEYMKHWGIQYYDGRGRAKNGYWAESKPNWKFIPADKKDTILHAFEGYVLALDLDLLGESSKVWELVEDVYLYFPSNGPVGTIVPQDTTIAIDTVGYHCNIDWYHKNDGSGETTGLPASYDRRFRDSHWHCIGVPSYRDVSHGITSGKGEGEYWMDEDGDGIADMPNPDKFPAITNWETLEIPYFYEWNMRDNQLYPKSNRSDTTFKAMYSYLVQYANDHITWSSVTISPKPSSVVERRKARLADDHFCEFNLHLMRNDQTLDHTYVRLTDNESATEAFEFGQDMSKELQGGVGIYTLIDELEVAGNSLPLNTESTTIVPVGVTIKANGTYTFSLPEGTEGIGVILVDNVAGTRTNLALMDYEVSLTTGKIDNRFWLEISPIAQTPTGIDNQGDDVHGAKLRKVIVDGILYIVKEGAIYDATGKRIQ